MRTSLSLIFRMGETKRGERRGLTGRQRGMQSHGRLTGRHIDRGWIWTVWWTLSSTASQQSESVHLARVGTESLAVRAMLEPSGCRTTAWQTDRPIIQADRQAEREAGWVSDGCTASHALMFSCQISLTENQWRCTLMETHWNHWMKKARRLNMQQEKHGMVIGMQVITHPGPLCRPV